MIVLIASQGLVNVKLHYLGTHLSINIKKTIGS